jgi:hypothetical protein
VTFAVPAVMAESRQHHPRLRGDGHEMRRGFKHEM